MQEILHISDIFLFIIKSDFFRAFTTLCYSADGTCILAGGRSKNVCIYNVQESILLKKYEITQNRSLDGVDVRNNFFLCINLQLIAENNIIYFYPSYNALFLFW